MKPKSRKIKNKKKWNPYRNAQKGKVPVGPKFEQLFSKSKKISKAVRKARKKKAKNIKNRTAQRK